MRLSHKRLDSPSFFSIPDLLFLPNFHFSHFEACHLFDYFLCDTFIDYLRSPLFSYPRIDNSFFFKGLQFSDNIKSGNSSHQKTSLSLLSRHFFA